MSSPGRLTGSIAAPGPVNFAGAKVTEIRRALAAYVGYAPACL